MHIKNENFLIGNFNTNNNYNYDNDKNDDCNNDNNNKNSNLSEKEKIMKIINTQDEIEGSWVENRETEVVKEKYLKEYNLLIGLKDKNVTEKIALTTIIILLVEKEYNELLGELNLIIKKAKKFIKEETKMTYQNLLKECGIN